MLEDALVEYGMGGLFIAYLLWERREHKAEVRRLVDEKKELVTTLLNTQEVLNDKALELLERYHEDTTQTNAVLGNFKSCLRGLLSRRSP